MEIPSGVTPELGPQARTVLSALGVTHQAQLRDLLSSDPLEDIWEGTGSDL